MTNIAHEHRVVLIRIPRTAPAVGDAHALYEATRRWWRIGRDRTKGGPTSPTHALSVLTGEVVAAYKIDGWEQRGEDHRWAFAGRPATGDVATYVGTDVRHYFPPGAANPVRFLHCGRPTLPGPRTVVAAPAQDPIESVRTAKHNRYTGQWQPAPDASARRDAVLAVAALAARPDLHASMRRKLVDEILWFMTEGTGKYSTRYRSVEALTLQQEVPAGEWRKLVAHDHVYTRSALALALEDCTDDASRWEVLSQSEACVVTREEHARLSKLGAMLAGWDRYAEAGISVVDMSTGRISPPDEVATWSTDEGL